MLITNSIFGGRLVFLSNLILPSPVWSDRCPSSPVHRRRVLIVAQAAAGVVVALVVAPLQENPERYDTTHFNFCRKETTIPSYLYPC